MIDQISLANRKAMTGRMTMTGRIAKLKGVTLKSLLGVSYNNITTLQ